MKYKFKELSPFVQIFTIFAIGLVSFGLISMVVNVVVDTLFPALSRQPEILIKEHPILYFILAYLPFQIGFFLIGGIYYSSRTENLQRESNLWTFRWTIWSAALFGCVFFLLPVFGEMNQWITNLFGVTEQLLSEKIEADSVLKETIGNVGSGSFYFSLLSIGLITGIGEEIFFRRFFFHNILHHTKKLSTAVFVSSIIFALLHFNYLQFIPLFIFGVALAMMYYSTKSIILGIIAHALNNSINLYWLANDSFPIWLEEISLKTTIPSTLLLMGLIYFFFRKQ